MTTYEAEHGLLIRIRLRLLPPSEGGRSRPVFSDYRASWDIGNTGVNDAPLVLDGQKLEPGEETIARIHPLRPEFWAQVTPGTWIHAYEGRRRVGEAIVLERVEGE